MLEGLERTSTEGFPVCDPFQISVSMGQGGALGDGLKLDVRD